MLFSFVLTFVDSWFDVFVRDPVILRCVRIWVRVHRTNNAQNPGRNYVIMSSVLQPRSGATMDRFNFRLVVVLGALGRANEWFLTVAGLKTRTIRAFAE
jgi:hypothetical protein